MVIDETPVIMTFLEANSKPSSAVKDLQMEVDEAKKSTLGDVESVKTNHTPGI